MRPEPFLSVPIESERRLQLFVLTRFLYANCSPLRWKTLYLALTNVRHSADAKAYPTPDRPLFRSLLDTTRQGAIRRSCSLQSGHLHATTSTVRHVLSPSSASP